MREWTRVWSALFVLVTTVLGGTVALAAPAHAVVASTTELAVTANPATVGEVVTVTVAVTGDHPTGEVTFGIDGEATTEPLDAAGTASLDVTWNAAGTHTLTASYAGDKGNLPSSDELEQVVVEAPVPPAPPVTPTTPTTPATPAAEPVPMPSVKLKASTAKASVGDKIRLVWRSRHAETVLASGDWRGSQASKGATSLRITDRGKHVYKLTVANATGHRTAKVVVVATRKAKTLSLVVTDEPVQVGDEVAVTADGLAKGEVYTVRLAGKVVLSGKADKRGDVRGRFTVAKGTRAGELPVTVTGSNPGRVGEATLLVYGPLELGVTVADAEVVKGTAQTVLVTGMLPGEEYTVTYLGKELTTGEADAAGTFSYEFVARGKLGEQTVTVVGALPTRAGEATFTVTKAGAGDPGDPGEPTNL